MMNNADIWATHYIFQAETSACSGDQCDPCNIFKFSFGFPMVCSERMSLHFLSQTFIGYEAQNVHAHSNT